MIVNNQLNVVRAIATGKLKLIPFDIKKAARLAAASQAAIRLVDLVREGGVCFPMRSMRQDDAPTRRRWRSCTAVWGYNRRE